MTYAELFAGIGGWSVGLKPCGWELKWQCECDPFCCAVLRKRFGVPIALDIKQIAGWIEQHPELAKVDAIVGSPPCPPFSVAGKKLSTSDARHLYPEFLESVRLLRPRYVLMEQVAGLLYDRRAFGEYIGGLEQIGYCVLWHSIPACAVGAPHQRDRVWVVAHAGYVRGGRWSEPIKPGFAKAANNREVLADSERGGRREQLRIDAEREPLFTTIGQEGASRIGSSSQTIRNAKCAGLEGTEPGEKQTITEAAVCSKPGAAWWATEPDVGRVANGVPNRVDRLRALGNALVPKIAYEIGQAINIIESQ